MIFKLILILFMLVPGLSLFADVSLNGLFTRHMVLQRDKPVNIYGLGTEGEGVTVTFNGQSKSATVSSGEWSVQLDAMTFNTTPQSLVVQGSNTITLTDILIGDVWVLGGQSNMHRGIAQYSDLSPDTINNPNIRMVIMEFNPPEPAGPIQNINFAYGATTWEPANFSAGGSTSNITHNVSATGLYFALELQPVLGIPIGLLGAYRGATRAECWTPMATLEAHPELQYYLDNSVPNDITKTNSWLYNAVIHPITRFTVKGVLWYQGESNGQAPWEHGFLFPRMIEAWRGAFNQGDIPFIFAQLASYKPLSWDLSGGLAYAYNKMSQRMGLKEPNTGMITLYDAGEWEDIHPQAKPTVGYRFAMKARELVYGENIISSGPTLSSIEIVDDNVRVNFANIGLGLESRDVSMRENTVEPFTYLTSSADVLTGFEVSGADEQYVAADAVIEGNSVIVSHSSVPTPVAVRYAFHSFTLANLYNKNGFPAEQFYTDTFDWPQFIDGHPSHPDPEREVFPLSAYQLNMDLQESHLKFSRAHNQLEISLADNSDNYRLFISNIHGQKVRVISRHFFKNGATRFYWDFTDDLNVPVSPGIYVFSIISPGNNLVARAVYYR